MHEKGKPHEGRPLLTPRAMRCLWGALGAAVLGCLIGLLMSMMLSAGTGTGLVVLVLFGTAIWCAGSALRECVLEGYQHKDHEGHRGDLLLSGGATAVAGLLFLIAFCAFLA